MNSNVAPSTTLLSAGRLEIYMQREWGTVCGNSFGGMEANISCRQMGFNFASHFGDANNLG